MSSISNYFKNLKNIPANWNKVKANPFAAVQFEYKAYKLVIWIIGILIVAQLGYSIFTLTRNSTPMSMVSSAFMLLIMVILIWKLYQFTMDKKKVMEQYMANPVHIEEAAAQPVFDVGAEVDAILAKYDDKGKLKVSKK